MINELRDWQNQQQRLDGRGSSGSSLTLEQSQLWTSADLSVATPAEMME